MRKIVVYLLMGMLAVCILTGCEDSPVQKCIIANVGYSNQSDLDEAVQQEMVNLEEDIQASIAFIESPSGTEYGVKWYLDGEFIEGETKTTVQDKHDVLVYELNTENLKEGTLKLEVLYKDKVLYTKEVKLQNGEA